MDTEIGKALKIDLLLAELENELAGLEARRAIILEKIKKLKHEKHLINLSSPEPLESKDNSLITGNDAPITENSPLDQRVSLFRSLFKGREDVYPKRFESLKTGKKGYQPDCRNEWQKGICGKPKIKCSACRNRELLPVTDEVIRNHLLGIDPKKRSTKDFTIGVYPLLPDEKCWFLAADFDKTIWMENVAALLQVCKSYNIPAILERSRSGNGGHVWIFFSEPIPAAMVRKMGSFILTEAMEHRPEIGFDSYDRLFPNQDTMPRGGFGSLIALPLQKEPSAKGHSLFLDERFMPYQDQWAFLSSIRRMDRGEVESIVEEAVRREQAIGGRLVVKDENVNMPWEGTPSRRGEEPPIKGPLPDQIELILGNQIYIAKEGLLPALKNRLIRIASFQNPEFYKAQALRLSTYGKSRVICCGEDFEKHIGIPRGCLDEIVELCHSLKIKPEISDRRYLGFPIYVQFHGTLRSEQQLAAKAMLEHDIGTLSATTAFGKTVIAAYLIAQRRVNTLVLVHRRQLLDQWISRLSAFLGLDPKDIGQIGGGKHKLSKIVDVAIIQSLSRKGTVDDLVGEYGHLIVDECHHISARSFEIVARECKARYVTGLSATVVRKDGHHPIIFMQCGPVRYQVDEREQAASRPFRHRVVIRKTCFRLSLALAQQADLSIHEVYAELIMDENRNTMIIEDVIKAVKAKHSPILLTERRDHLMLLADRLSPVVRNVIILKGGMRQKERRLISEKLANIKDEEERVIVATGRYLGEGFDDARLDCLFLALPVSWKGTLAQYAGRLHRLHDLKKEVVIYDYADLAVPLTAKMFKRRQHGYKALGYEIGG